MSALPPKEDMQRRCGNVCFVQQRKWFAVAVPELIMLQLNVSSTNSSFLDPRQISGLSLYYLKKKNRGDVWEGSL
jgi:hypothetical protein